MDLLGDVGSLEGKLIDMLENAKTGEEIDRSEFWSIVKKVKNDPKLTTDLANLIGEVDSELFRRSSLLKLPMVLGNLFALVGVFFGISLLFGAFYPGTVPSIGSVSPELVRGGMFVLAQLVLGTAVHPLGHQLSGRRHGIRFAFFFLNGPAKVEPTVKTDYSTYLKATARGRAKMHISGAVATNLATLFVLLVALLAEVPLWTLGILAALFLFGAINEFVPAILVRMGREDLFSMNKTDTYRYLREKRYAREAEKERRMSRLQ